MTYVGIKHKKNQKKKNAGPKGIVLLLQPAHVAAK
jgi:hypothetical protein